MLAETREEQVKKKTKPLVLSMQEYDDSKERHHEGAMTLFELQRDGLPELIHYDFSNTKILGLRDIQEKTLTQAREAIGKGFNRLVLSLSTGSGKTYLSAYMMLKALEKDSNQTIFFCVNRDTLITNAKEEIERKLGVKVGIIQGQTPLNLELPIQIVSLQTIQNRLDEEKNSVIPYLLSQLNIKLIFNDECHYDYKGIDSITKMIEKEERKYYLFGLTATAFAPFLSEKYQVMIKPSLMREQIEQGILTDYKLFCFKESMNLDGIKKNSAGEYQDKASGEEVSKFLVIGEPAKDWYDNEDTRNKFTVIYCPDIASCEAMYEHWCESGVIPEDEIGIMHSKRGDTNASTLNAIKFEGSVRVIVSCNLLREGVDLPHLGCLIFFSPLARNKTKKDEPKSIQTLIQRHGRGVRAYDGGVIIERNGKRELLNNKDNFVLEGEYEVIEVLPKKEYLTILDYTDIDQFACPVEIDSRYIELQKKKTKKEVLEEQKLAEEAILKAIEEGDAESLAGASICGHCGSPIKQLPICDFCGFTVKKVRSQIAPDVEIEYVDGECHIAHIPEGYKNKLEKRKEDKKKKSKNVNYKSLTDEQKIKVMAAVEIAMTEKHVGEEKKKSVRYAMYKGVVGAEQMPTNGNSFAALKRHAIRHVQKVDTDRSAYNDIQKYVSKVQREQIKYWRKK